jgi:hypothetical protein
MVDYELREIEFDRKEIEDEQRMLQLQNECEQLEQPSGKLDALLSSSSTNSSSPQSTQGNSKA